MNLKSPKVDFHNLNCKINRPRPNIIHLRVKRRSKDFIIFTVVSKSTPADLESSGTDLWWRLRVPPTYLFITLFCMSRYEEKVLLCPGGC